MTSLFFLILAVLYSDIGEISKVRVTFFGTDPALGSPEQFGRDVLDGKYAHDLKNYLSEDKCSLSAPLTLAPVTVDVPVDDIVRVLGEDNAADKDSTPFLTSLAGVCTELETVGGIRTGSLSIANCSGISRIRSDGSVIDKVHFVIGTRRMYRPKKHSRNFVRDYDPDCGVTVIDWEGSTEITTVDDVRERLSAEPEDRDTDVFMCGNMLPDGSYTCGEIYRAVVYSTVRCAVKYPECIVNIHITGLGYCFSSNLARSEIYNSVSMTSLPDSCETFLVPDTFPPINVFAAGRPECRNFIMKDFAVDTVKLLCDMAFASSAENTIRSFRNSPIWANSSQFFYMRPPYLTPPEYGTIRLPETAAGGFIIEAGSIEKLILPKVCGNVFGLSLDRSDMQTLDYSAFNEAAQFVNISDARELTTARIGGKNICSFSAGGLEKLKELTVDAESLDHLTINLFGISSERVDIYLEVRNSELFNSYNDGLMFPGNFASEYIDIMLGAEKPVNVVIHNKYGHNLRISQKCKDGIINVTVLTD